VSIPLNFEVYNSYFMWDDLKAAKGRYEHEVPMFGGGQAGKCISCGACEDMCPQKIAIADWMPKIHEFLTT
jgi:predicted aldo/keto reductase-like oxidoreductase